MNLCLCRCFKDEQMAICVRYSKNFKVYERFLAFVNVSESQNAESLSSAILSFLERYNLSKIPIVSQSFDGASVMSGEHGGVQKKIRDHYPYAIYTHCMAHRCNLIVVDICKSFKVFSISLQFKYLL